MRRPSRSSSPSCRNRHDLSKQIRDVCMLFLVLCQNHVALTCKHDHSSSWRNFRKRQYTVRNLHFKCEVSLQQMLQAEHSRRDPYSASLQQITQWHSSLEVLFTCRDVSPLKFSTLPVEYHRESFDLPYQNCSLVNNLCYLVRIMRWICDYLGLFYALGFYGKHFRSWRMSSSGMWRRVDLVWTHRTSWYYYPENHIKNLKCRENHI
jgi:hypothetical protein